MLGPKTIAEVCAATEISDFEVCQLLWGYCALDWVGPVTEIPSKAASEPEVIAEAAPPAPAEPIPVVEAAAKVESQNEEVPVEDDKEEDLEGLGMMLKNDP